MRLDSPHSKSRRFGLALAAFLCCGTALADDVRGSDALLCYGLSAARCEHTGVCEQKEPWQLNLPDFLKVDLKAKQATTTAGSGPVRETKFQTVQRDPAGTILLQGVQGERAFSWIIVEETGEGTMTVSTVAAGLTVFTVCTPIDKL